MSADQAIALQNQMPKPIGRPFPVKGADELYGELLLEAGLPFVALAMLFVLLAVAVPSYLGFKDRAKAGAAQANVRSAVPAVEALVRRDHLASDPGAQAVEDAACLVFIETQLADVATKLEQFENAHEPTSHAPIADAIPTPARRQAEALLEADTELMSPQWGQGATLDVFSPSLADDPAAHAEFEAAIAQRPLWLAASTHAEDEAVALEPAHGATDAVDRNAADAG